MASSSVKIVDDATLKEAEMEVTAVLVHLKQLLRVKNRHRSPLLRLPTEIIIHILSFVMEDMGSYPAWRPIFTTCYCIRGIMTDATALWWKVDISLGREAKFALMRSQGNPRTVVARFTPWDEWEMAGRESVLVNWRDQWVLQGRRLHSLVFYGTPSSLPRFCWIFKTSLPCLDRLKFHVVSGVHDDIVSGPVALQLPTNTPLRVLDLHNATLPWSSDLFTGLRELHLDFSDVTVSITEDELLRILDGSPQLERLSLVQVRQTIPVNGDQRLLPKHVVQLPVLNSLKLDNDPKVVGFTMAHVHTPALVSLEIHSRISDWDVARSLDHFFPDNRLQRRLFSDPPVFEVGRPYHYGGTPPLEFSIGSFKVRFDINADDAEAHHNATAACVRLVPPSVTTLKLEMAKLDGQQWKEFFRSHPEIQSIECTDFRGEPMPDSFWGALSPTEDDGWVTLCPKLDSIVCKVYTDTDQLTSLLVCLLHREYAGFKLRHLKIVDSGKRIYRIAEIIRPLIEVLEVDFPSQLKQKVSSTSLDRPGIR